MPTARELLEQAEALMQRDRAAMMSDGIPTLTDSVAAPDGAVPAIDVRRAPSALDDVPLLTETVEDFDTPSIPLSQVLDDELALWRETPASHAADRTEGITADVAPVETLSVPEPAPQPAVATTPAHANEAPAAEIDIRPDPALLERLPGGEPPTVAAPNVDDDARWNALAEDIRMQVLQRIDIFTDTGLKDQLNQRLQPIVDRASADLVAAINQHVGQLLRAYVAEAIEREIEKWRANSR